MDSFKTKYPALAALIAILASEAKIIEAPGESIAQKGANEIGELPALIAFLPQVGLLGAEIKAIEATPTDLFGAAELIVTDLSFTSEKAQSIIALIFPYAQKLAGLIPDTKALIAAIKA